MQLSFKNKSQLVLCDINNDIPDKTSFSFTTLLKILSVCNTKKMKKANTAELYVTMWLRLSPLNEVGVPVMSITSSGDHEN